MPFQQILTRLKAADEEFLATLFVDDSGEVVGMACRQDERDRMQLVGAYLPLYLQRVRDTMDGAGLGSPLVVHIERDGMQLHAAVLPDDYVLSVVASARALASTTRQRLRQAARELVEEVFGAGG